MNYESYSILIDTCSMARISLYCEVCNQLKMTVGTSIDKIESEIKIKQGFPLIDSLSFLKEGYSIYKYLKEKRETRNAFILYFSQFAKIELYDIFLDISFDEMLTKNGISYRLRRKKPFRWQVDFDFNKQVKDRYDLIENSLNKINILISIPEKESPVTHNLPFDINSVLLSHVFLDSFDSYLYSLSLSLMVDDFLTSDNELRDIIKKFQSDKEWKTHLDNMKKSIIQISSSHREMCYDENTHKSQLTKFHLPNIPNLKK